MEEKDNSVGKPEEEESGQPEVRGIIPEGLKKVLKEHGKWIDSGGTEGAQANLQGANLVEANLVEANLMEANLQGADLGRADLRGANLLLSNLREAVLTRANLQKANLMEANLQGANPVKANFHGASLLEANLQGATLFEGNLQGADLHGANLQGANLVGAKLQETDLGSSNLREAILQDADLTGAKRLQGGQLAGANVSGAKLPEDVAKFEEGLKVVEEASRNARKLFFAMLSACAYALLTIATTTDVRLLTNSASSPLPIIRTEIPIVWFYIAAPLVLLCLYFYFHLYMQRLWEGLAELPAIFPDGRPLDKKAYPWLLTGLVRAHVLHLREDRPPLSGLQEWISIFLAWMFMPAMLICFWLRYIPRQDWFGTGLHIALLVVVVWAGVLFYRLAVGTLRWDENELSFWKKPFKKIMAYKRGVLAIRLGLILLLLSLGTINGVHAINPFTYSPLFLFSDARTWVPYVFEQFGFSPFANFKWKDVSTKPPNWSGKEQEIPLVKGAPLRGRNLRYVIAKGAFLVNADLQYANLYGASFEGANLQKANLAGANLRRANLYLADLRGADFLAADLWKADLTRANLRGAINLDAIKLSEVKTLYMATGLDSLGSGILAEICNKHFHLLLAPEEK